jgi:hypothetical protein
MLRICNSVDDAQEAKAIRRNIDLSSFSSIGQRTRMRVGFSRIPGGWLGGQTRKSFLNRDRSVNGFGEDHGF